eukprot:12097797-Prorocentrum_lima.AAC.1
MWLLRASLDVAVPWVGVVLLLQTVTAERASCMRSARRPASLSIRKVNGETHARQVPLAASLSGLFHP